MKLLSCSSDNKSNSVLHYSANMDSGMGKIHMHTHTLFPLLDPLGIEKFKCMAA